MKTQSSSQVSARINSIMLQAKEVLSGRENLSLQVQRKNAVTKIYSEAKGDQEPFVFLCSLSYFNSQRMLEVVTAVLLYNRANFSMPQNIDNAFVLLLVGFLENSATIMNVVCDDKVISLFNDCNERFDLFTDTLNVDLTALHVLSRSLMMLIAMSGKSVSSHLDSSIINDYGLVISWDKYE